MKKNAKRAEPLRDVEPKSVAGGAEIQPPIPGEIHTPG